jgi:predicted hydrocarbon binding protein
MIGLIFTSLADMIEDRYGLMMWNEIVREAAIPDYGAYTAGQVYPDEQIVKLVTVIGAKLNLGLDDVLKTFGQHVFSYLAGSYPDISNHFTNAKDMLMHVDDYIHKEIAFYHPQEVGLPMFKCIDTGDKSLTMLYRSPRRLCFLAEGVIQGVASHYGCRISLLHTTCLHKGDEQCTFELVIND